MASKAEAEGCWPPSTASEENPAAPPCDPLLLPHPIVATTAGPAYKDPTHESSAMPSPVSLLLLELSGPYPILGQPLLQGPAQRSPEHAASLPTRRLFPGLGEVRRGGWPSRPPTPIPSPCSSRAPHCISPTPTTLLLRTQRGPRRASTASCHGLLGRVYKHLVKSVRILQSKS